MAGAFFRDFEQRRKDAEGWDVAFRFVDEIYFFAVAAASGVLGNLAYDALCGVVRAVRKPKKEIGGGVKFEAVISRTLYNRVRRQNHPNARARNTSPTIEKKLETEYKLMVRLWPTKR